MTQRQPLTWRWAERDFGFRFRADSGRKAAEYYQAARPGEFYVVDKSKRKLPKDQAEGLAASGVAPTSPRTVPNPWQHYDQDWDCVTTGGSWPKPPILCTSDQPLPVPYTDVRSSDIHGIENAIPAPRARGHALRRGRLLPARCFTLKQPLTATKPPRKRQPANISRVLRWPVLPEGLRWPKPTAYSWRFGPKTPFSKSSPTWKTRASTLPAPGCSTPATARGSRDSSGRPSESALR